MKLEQQQELMARLSIMQKLSLAEAMEILNVSESTIRRIFAKMEKEGVAIRTHGGIQSASGAMTRYSFEYGTKTNIEKKTAIAREACKLLKNGDVSAADKLLCGGFILTGEVKKDRGIGATIGFPTANIFYPEGKTELKKGVYETRAEVGGVTYKGITNFGSRPTFGNDTVVTETHLIGFRGNLYGKTLTVRFVRYLRDVAAFKNAEELTARLNADVKRVEEGK